MVFYEYLRDHVFGKNKDGSFDVWKAVVCGMSSGWAAQFLASPTDLVKVRLQMDGRRRLEGLEARYRGTVHAFRSIVEEQGVRGLWRGAVPNSQRAALACLGDATTYDTAKRFLLLQLNFKDNTLTHCLSRWVWLV
jgi:solute carrier family 25 uncoupling protein 27